MRVITVNNVSNLSFDTVVKRHPRMGAVMMLEDFQVPKFDGDIEEGGAGDFLISSEGDELSVCKKEDFYRLYRMFVPGVDD